MKNYTNKKSLILGLFLLIGLNLMAQDNQQTDDNALVLGKGLQFNFNNGDYQFRIGPNVFPPKAPATPVEIFAETLKAIGSISDINQQPSIDKASFTLQNSVNTAALHPGALRTQSID
jgi:hypothetical protein